MQNILKKMNSKVLAMISKVLQYWLSFSSFPSCFLLVILHSDPQVSLFLSPRDTQLLQDLHASLNIHRSAIGCPWSQPQKKPSWLFLLCYPNVPVWVRPFLNPLLNTAIDKLGAKLFHCKLPPMLWFVSTLFFSSTIIRFYKFKIVCM